VTGVVVPPIARRRHHHHQQQQQQQQLGKSASLHQRIFVALTACDPVLLRFACTLCPERSNRKIVKLRTFSHK